MTYIQNQVKSAPPPVATSLRVPKASCLQALRMVGSHIIRVVGRLSEQKLDSDYLPVHILEKKHTKKTVTTFWYSNLTCTKHTSRLLLLDCVSDESHLFPCRTTVEGGTRTQYTCAVMAGGPRVRHTVSHPQEYPQPS